MSKLKFGDRVMLLEPEMCFTDSRSYKPGDLYGYIKIGDDGLHELVTKHATVVYVCDGAIKSGFIKCGHCESCVFCDPPNSGGECECAADGHLITDPERHSCVDSWDLNDEWAQDRINSFQNGNSSKEGGMKTIDEWLGNDDFDCRECPFYTPCDERLSETDLTYCNDAMDLLKAGKLTPESTIEEFKATLMDKQ